MGAGERTQIGPYRIEAVLGKGASGVVYRVRDPQLERGVALKLLTDDLDEEARARFTIEARAAARIIHPNVVQVFSASEFEGHSFITQELVEGYPLSDLLDVRGQLSPHSVIDIGMQVCAGLQAAADVGVLHRDVKPQNLLVTDQGLVKLVDFGLAKILGAPSGLTDTGTTLGTPHYMSPEQGQGTKLDHRADQYSLGATLYHLACGQPPHDADNALTLLLKHLQEPLQSLSERAPDCPPGLCAIVERMLSKKAEDRYEDFSQVSEALEALLEEEAEHEEIIELVKEAAHQEPESKPNRRPVKERLLVAAAITAAAAVVGVSQLESAPPHTTSATERAASPALSFKPALSVAAAPAAKVQALGAARVDLFAPPPRARLSKKTRSVARVAAQRPKRAKPSAVRLIRQLRGSSKRAQTAAQQLGAMGDHQATQPLIRLLTSSDEAVAVAAARALGELGDIEAIEPLRKAAKESKSAGLRDAAEKARRRLWSVEESP